MYLATIGRRRLAYRPGSMARSSARFDERIADAIVKKAVAEPGVAETRPAEQYDRYYLDRRGNLPLPVLLARLNDADGAGYYIDPRTARIVGSYNAADWSSRWLYHGLHSLDFPWLYNHRPAVGHRGHRVHAGRHCAVGDVAGAGVASGKA